MPTPGGFELEASNGFRLLVSVEEPQPDGRPTVVVGAFRRGELVAYFAKSRTMGRRVEADLGAIGHVDVRYVPDGSVGYRAVSCEHQVGKIPRVYFQRGEYVGSVEFKGEEGFTEASATRIPGNLDWHARCPSGVSEGFPGPGIVLDTGTGGRAFSAVQNKPGEKVLFEASILEHLGALAIYREVLDLGSPSDLIADPGLRSASVAPPPPFAGTGLFTRHGRPLHRADGRWSGDLTVDFPGHPDVSLSGSGFDARLVHGFRETTIG